MIEILLRSRLRWYALATGRLLLRRWQALLLTLAVLAPMGVSLLSQVKSLAFPVLLLMSPEDSFAWRYTYICTMQALAVIWIMMQRDQVGGGEFMQYAQSLPLTRKQRSTVDLLIVSTANSPLFLMPIAAICWFFVQDQSAFAWLLHCLFILVFLVLMTITQLQALHRQYTAWTGIAFANILLAWAPGSSPTAQLILLGLTLASVGLWESVVPAPAHIPFVRALQNSFFKALSMASLSRVHPAAFIPLHFLLRQSLAETLGKVVVSIGIAALALGLMAVWEYDERIVPLAVIALACIALVISGLYRDLHMAHSAARPIVAALPLPDKWERKFDTALLMLLGMPFAAVLGSVIVFHHARLLAAVLLASATYVALIGILRLPQVNAERQAVFLSSVSAALWAVLTLFVHL
ncbi:MULTISPECIES: hypothetical protein [unclassified Janthinobacterium]|uniref:hypothetical protein n=1 Tax=unclassified Janthinobacterium TaxID=2610881 RepID=UPI000376FDAB|nr:MULTISPECIES: hypothetical protein [unclassified Janthinobacterium]MEC5160917.1 drug/metabolite transporter superfamily protein YnfA [Janthinobacterium sp. CG_S6]